MFADYAKITVRSGDGGNGCVSFHREKYVAAGGPDGGAGGRGGDIVFVADKSLNSLVDFRYKRKYVAGNGEDGAAKNCTGKSGRSLVIRVPVGTLIREAATGAVMKDMSDTDPYVLARGGAGGWGNARYANAVRQAPRFSRAGRPGTEYELILELKLIADVGLVALPNVGKSTLLSVVSAARPKIANYHFTTLSPNLGVVRVDEGESFVMADIPGIIGGASQGVGLGLQFLRHIERCRLLVHMVDVASTEGRDPIEDYETINAEMRRYSPALAEKPQIVVGNKADAVTDRARADAFRAHVEAQGRTYVEISAAARTGVQELVYLLWERVQQLPRPAVFEPDYRPQSADTEDRAFTIRQEGGVYYVEGDWLLPVINSTNFDDYESISYFQRQLEAAGVYAALEEAGIEEGATVNIYDVEFDYIF